MAIVLSGASMAGELSSEGSVGDASRHAEREIRVTTVRHDVPRNENLFLRN